MKKNVRFPLLGLGCLSALVLLHPGGLTAHAEIKLEVLGSLNYGLFDESAAEISAFDPSTDKLFVTQASGRISVVDLSNPELPIEVDLLDVGPVNSVAVANGLLAVAVEADPKQDPGSIIVYNTADLSAPLNTFTVGSLPDMVTFTPDGLMLLVANEGEPDDDYLVDPEGSISIIDLGDGMAATISALGQAAVTPVDFHAYDERAASLRNKGVRIFGPNATVSQDLEPEYIAVSPDGTTAYAACQENNALAVVDLESKSLVDILALGTKDHNRGLPTATIHEIPEANLPVLGTSTADDTTPVLTGGFSGLWFAADESDEDTYVFYTHGDRGPNGDSFSVDGITHREFLLPDYQASLIRLEMDPNTGEIIVESTLPLYRADGTTPISGLPNIPGWDEQPLDGKGNALPHDPYGADMEGVVKAPDGTFWMVDEYRPAIYHFLADGTLNARYVPAGTSTLGDTPQAEGFYGMETLPAEYALRRPNRGFEAVAYDTDNDIVYAFIQTPMYNPDNSTRNNSDVIRILGIDPADGTPVAEYVYLLERNALDGAGISRVDKIGDAVYTGNGTFHVLERDSSTPDDGFVGKKFIFEINLTGATNLLGADAPALNAGLTLEQHSADDLDALGIQPVFKSKVANLPSLGYLPSDKPEGLAALPDGTLAVVNDNDFTVAGFPTLALALISFDGATLDASNRDDGIHLANWPVHGTFMPDAIATMEFEGMTYILSANEGDAREYEGDPGYVGEDRIGDVTLDPDAFPDAATLQDDANLGRLKLMLSEGDLDGDGDYDRLQSYGARSFSVWDAYGNLVWDSGDFFESYTAANLPEHFNSSDGNDSFDSRSDDKGPEPEGVTTGLVDGVPYAFIGLERVGGIMVFDMSDPMAPAFVDYVNNRDFDAEDEFAGDIAPEGIVFISAEDSPVGEPILVVTNEVSGTVTTYWVREALADGAYTLNILHNNDGESQLINAGSDLESYGGIDRFVSLVRDRKRIAHSNEWTPITISSGDNFLAGPEFNASFVTRGSEDPVYYDAIGLGNIGYNAIVIGNHDFDFGPTVLAEFISAVDADVPYLSANLDMSAEEDLQELVDSGRIAGSTTLTVETTAGEKTVTIIGATTANLPFISSPGGVVVEQDVAAAVQAQIDANADSDVIIFVSHLQGVDEDVALIGAIRGIDIAIAGGGDDLLANEENLLLPGDVSDADDTYPIYAADADGVIVPIVTTTGEYRYLGNLVVEFDSTNTITMVGGRPIPVADISTLWPDSVRPDADTTADVVEPVAAYLEGLANTIVASTDVPLDGRRNSIRGVETAMGNLVADAMLWAAQTNGPEFGVDSVHIALVGGGGIRNNTILNIDAATDFPISELDTFDILPFSNFVSVVEGITPAQLKQQLETVYSRTVVEDGEVIPQGSGTGRYAQIAGLAVTYDPTRQAQLLSVDGEEIIAGERILSAVLSDGTMLIDNGQPVDGAPSVNVCVTSFHAGGGDQYFWFLEEIPFANLGLTYQQALAAYLQAPVAQGGLGGEVNADPYGELNRILIPRDALIFEWETIEVQGWRLSGWMGAVWTEALQDTPEDLWVYLPAFGWTFISGQTTGPFAVWMFNEENGWFFTNKVFYPYVWSHSTGEWYFVDMRFGTNEGIRIIRLSDNEVVENLRQ